MGGPYNSGFLQLSISNVTLPPAFHGLPSDTPPQLSCVAAKLDLVASRVFTRHDSRRAGKTLAAFLLLSQGKPARRGVGGTKRGAELDELVRTELSAEVEEQVCY